MTALPALLSREEVLERLRLIFPEGTTNRGWIVRELGASTVFTALYIGAVEGSEVLLGPKHVYRMTHEQAARTADDERKGYAKNVLKGGFHAEGRRWYQDTTREPIRDEALREGLVALGAVGEKSDLPTTSSKPRYALRAGFAALFDPALTGPAMDDKIEEWQAASLSKGALARQALIRGGAAAAADQVLVHFPNGETRRLKPGPSSIITKALVEEFSTRFLKDPAVLFISESGNKVVQRDDQLARSIGLEIQADKDLPDTILVDMAPPTPLLVFCEVVATDGPVSERRKAALEQLVEDAGYPIDHVAFVTCYLDRSSQPFRKTVASLAWGTYAWFVAEPDQLMILSEQPAVLSGRV